ncbi:uncharacterized protein TrAtP1_003988 [Trichoderma atroviride]|uniref:uncharacterized protein n=1 Tax=Hypocrea atroviridis TaxID=63577 RepID=UPI00331CE611|nr:hypothetical protein TrAtP1_003988 [Trichoderma atroviride]
MDKKCHHPIALFVFEQVAKLPPPFRTEHKLRQAPQPTRDVRQDIHAFVRKCPSMHTMRCEGPNLCQFLRMALAGNAGCTLTS